MILKSVSYQRSGTSKDLPTSESNNDKQICLSNSLPIKIVKSTTSLVVTTRSQPLINKARTSFAARSNSIPDQANVPTFPNLLILKHLRLRFQQGPEYWHRISNSWQEITSLLLTQKHKIRQILSARFKA